MFLYGTTSKVNLMSQVKPKADRKAVRQDGTISRIGAGFPQGCTDDHLHLRSIRTPVNGLGGLSAFPAPVSSDDDPLVICKHVGAGKDSNRDILQQFRLSKQKSLP